ncbi:unnamed protein product [Durusdinium trenchii]|uniref:Uncharacterized protein n=2 Tax=Durusdinium trenchii TaxID=1381693 RepID=A0ABP0P696_9DINO
MQAVDRLAGQDGMSKSALENVIAILSFSPTAFGIFFLMTSRDTTKYEDQNGTSGVMAGLMCLAYGLCAGAASSSCPADFCKALVLGRMGLGVVAMLAGIFILALGDETDEVLKFVLMYLFLALMTVPEAGSFYLYVRQVQIEKFMAQNSEPQWQGNHPAMPAAHSMQHTYVQPWPPGPVNVPQFSGGDFGVGGGGGVAQGGDFGLSAPSSGPVMSSAAPPQYVPYRPGA